jgi:hypothetical protein
VPILQFLVYVAVVVVFTLALGYCLSVEEERTEEGRTVSHRCRMPHDLYRRRNEVRRRRVRCRFQRAS